jgi:hypothetical protein
MQWDVVMLNSKHIHQKMKDGLFTKRLFKISANGLHIGAVGDLEQET